MKSASTALFLSLFAVSAFAQQKTDIVNYIKQYKLIAIEEMVRTKIPASITISQGILESGCGKSPLSREANNHFGIKCKNEWVGKKFIQDDDEANECFRVYEHAEASYVDHSDFLLTRYRYAPLFELSATDYKSWATGLKEVGYATNPKYASILTTYIETYKLHELDLIAVAQIEEKEKLLAHSESAQPTPLNTATEIKPVVRQTTISKEVVTTKGGKQELIVNGVCAIKAVGDEDPLQVAFDYNIDYSFVMIFNELSPGERFKDGEYIYLQAKKNRAEQATYIAQAGESMRDISQRLGIKLKDLYAKNLMVPNEQVYPGEVLHLQDNKRAQPPRAMSYYAFLKTLDKPTGNSQYQVQRSDTLYSIAKRFNITVEELRQLNNLDSTEVKAGQTLVVSR